MEIRAAVAGDEDSVWAILKPVIRAGETYALPVEMTRADALDYWLARGHRVFVAIEGGAMVGTYYLRANQSGGGAHVANCGYMVAQGFEGRGVARAMCEHSLKVARAAGFRAMQFNFVVSANTRAVDLWRRLGFAIAGRLPRAFRHPELGYIEALVMFRSLEDDPATGRNL